MKSFYKKVLLGLSVTLAAGMLMANTSTETDTATATKETAKKVTVSSKETKAVTWTENFRLAKKEAAKENKFILMDFTGSDWCPWCIKLEKEVFSQKEFQEFASKNLILFKADFPKARELSKEIKEQNQKLAEKFGVEGFPTVFLLAPDGKTKVLQTGYAKGGSVKYIKTLQTAIDTYKAKHAKKEMNTTKVDTAKAIDKKK